MKHYILNVNQNQQSKGYQLVDNLYFLAIHWRETVELLYALGYNEHHQYLFYNNNYLRAV